MEKTYFDNPTQVIFADPDNTGSWLVGIAYCENIICACCGGVFEIDEVIEMAHEDGIKCAIYEYSNWAPFSDEIYGGVLPIGLAKDENGNIFEE